MTRTVNRNVPLVVGVPEIDPLEELSDRPGGSCPAEIENWYGAAPPETVRAALYDWPSVAEPRLPFKVRRRAANNWLEASTRKKVKARAENLLLAEGNDGARKNDRR